MKKFYKNRDEEADKEIKTMKEIYKSENFDENFIRKLVAEQNGELSVNSIYWKKEKISSGNWSKIEDAKIESLDEEVVLDKSTHNSSVDALDVILGLDHYLEDNDEEDLRENNAEYEYVFIPSYYAVMSLIKYYLENKEKALKIYNLKNAVVKEYKGTFHGGLPFILKYLEKFSKDNFIADIKFDFANIMEELINHKILI